MAVNAVRNIAPATNSISLLPPTKKLLVGDSRLVVVVSVTGTAVDKVRVSALVFLIRLTFVIAPEISVKVLLYVLLAGSDITPAVIMLSLFV